MKHLLEQLENRTTLNYSNKVEVQAAFKLGIFYADFPKEWWSAVEPSRYTYIKGVYKDHDYQIDFISDTSTSWHPIYRAFRDAGWERVEVHRDGGLLQYLLSKKNKDSSIKALLLLNISISTCRRVLLRTETKEVEIYETVCEDLSSPEGEDEALPQTVPESNSPSSLETSDDIPF